MTARAYGFGISRASGYPLTDQDIEAVANRLGIPATQALRNDVQRAIIAFVDLTTMELGVTEHPYNVVNRVMWTIAEGPGEALRLIIAAVAPESEREWKITDAEALGVYAYLECNGLDVKRLSRDGVVATITMTDLYALTGRARIELRRYPWTRRPGKPDDLLLATFVERLVSAAERAGYDLSKMPAAWRPLSLDAEPPRLVRFVDTALAMAMLRLRTILDHHRLEIGDAIGERICALDALSERAIADRIAAVIKGRKPASIAPTSPRA